MPRSNARTRSINIPKEFLPLIMDETEKKGYFSSVQMMGEILAEHYKGSQPKAEKGKSPVKGVIKDEKGS
ncbi:hypothetical protein ES703_11798 [subsurface metagenome]